MGVQEFLTNSLEVEVGAVTSSKHACEWIQQDDCHKDAGRCRPDTIESRAQREHVVTSKALATNPGIDFMASTNRLISQLEIRFFN